jgi:hypothetical protein
VEALLTTAVGVGFITGGTVAALAGARAVYLVAGLGGLGVIAWTLTCLRARPTTSPDAAFGAAVLV